MLDGPYWLGSLPFVLIARPGCLALKLLPVAIYVAVNGFHALTNVLRRVALVDEPSC